MAVVILFVKESLVVAGRGRVVGSFDSSDVGVDDSFGAGVVSTIHLINPRVIVWLLCTIPGQVKVKEASGTSC